MLILAGLLALDAILHAVLVLRFGARENMRFAIYIAVYAALALIVILAVPFALWAALVLSAIGFVGLSATFNQSDRDKTLDRLIWVNDVAVIGWTVWMLFFA